MNDASAQKSYANYVLVLLVAVNLLNYIDRQVLYAVFPLIKADLRLTDTELGMLGSAFMLCYMVSAPLFGWLGDKGSRPRLAAFGLALWSLATTGGGFAYGYATLLASRTVVGVGEASFGTVSPGLLAGFFPKERRGRILAYFYLAIPVGSALGYLLGGVISQKLGWHAAFLMVGLPGMLLVFPLSRLRDPSTLADNSRQVTKGTMRYFGGNRSFIVTTLAMAAMTFALGGLAQWLPSFLNRVHHLDVARANTLFGAITVVAGIGGTLTGGWLGDRFQKTSPGGYLQVSGWGFLMGVPLAVIAILAPSVQLCLTAIFFAEFFLFLNTGPLNTVIVNVTSPELRATAFAINIFFIHALGDAISPAVIGYCSDLWGLRSALLITPLAVLLAACFCFVCTRFIAADMAGCEG